jgi:hypothetical protein
LQAEDRHQLAQVIRVTQACQALLEVSSTPAATATQHKAKRKRPMAQASRRRNRREGYPWRAGHRSCGGLNEVCPAEAMSVQGGRVQRELAMQSPQEVQLSPEEGEALIERLERDALSADDRRLLVQVVRLLFWLLLALQETKLSLKRLRTLVFGQKPQARKAPPSGAASDSGGAEGSRGRVSLQPGVPTAEGDGQRGRPGGHRLGQGRQGAQA